MPKIKTPEDRFCVNSTYDHKENVKELLLNIATILRARGEGHDDSKLEDPEFSLFSVYTPKLAALTYGSEQYKYELEQLKPALEHHYANNRHHPEHFKNGVQDMNLVDIVEMFVDWYAASKRHTNGNIRKSIEINKERFKFSEELEQIFINTIELLDN